MILLAKVFPGGVEVAIVNPTPIVLQPESRSSSAGGVGRSRGKISSADSRDPQAHPIVLSAESRFLAGWGCLRTPSSSRRSVPARRYGGLGGSCSENVRLGVISTGPQPLSSQSEPPFLADVREPGPISLMWR